MNILITVASYYPLKDGVQSVTQYMAEGLVKRGHNVTVFTSMKESIREFNEKHNGVDIVRFNLFTKHNLHFGDKNKYLKSIKKFDKSVDVMINVCTQTAFTDLVLPLLKKLSCKKILYMHGMIDFRWKKENFKSLKYFFRKLYSNTVWKFMYYMNSKNFKIYDKVIQIHSSLYGVDFMREKYGIKCEIIENAVDDIFFYDSEIYKLSGENKEYFIYVSNYLKNKNQEDVLESFYMSDIENVSLIFIGSYKNDYYKKIVDLKKEFDRNYGYREVLFLYNVDRTDIVKYLKGASVFLMSSKVEMLPLVIMEAMACGVPFICNDVGCVRHLPGGIIVNSKIDMKYSIEKLFNDKTLRNELSQKGEDYALKHFKINSKVKMLEHMILKI